MEHDENNQAASLPEDLLADILGRLAPTWLAVSRCVCKPWKATIDARGLLLRTYGLLPLRLEGIFLCFTGHKFPELFFRPGAPIDGEMDFLPSANKYTDDEQCEVQDHCNGLLLLQDRYTEIPTYVVNPATQRWDPLPARPPIHATMVEYCGSDEYLVYDPMVSPHYEVFMIPHFNWLRDGECFDPSFDESEWPPATFILNVFSSRTRCWEPRSFDREGDALGTVAETRARKEYSTGSWWCQRRRAVYRGATLYVHCDKDFLMRISLSNGMLRATELPEGAISNDYTETYLGRSKRGVYFASLYKQKLRVWILYDPCGKMQWMLQHDQDLVLPRHAFGRKVAHGPWVLQDTNYDFFSHRMRFVEKDVFDEEDFEWSSDEDDDIVDGRDTAGESYRGDITILGFHPFKEIIFLLLIGSMTPLAYHYNSLKAEVLGKVEPTGYPTYFTLPNDARTIEGFPYVPCWFDEFPTNTKSGRSS